METLQNSKKRGKLTTVNDLIVCPICHTRTMFKVGKNTKAENLPVYCRKCKTEFLVNIEQGQSFYSQR